MASRLAQLALVDVLATGLFLRKGPQFIANLKNVKEAIKESRLEQQDDADGDRSQNTGTNDGL